MAETWNPGIPLITNQVAADILDIEENFDYLMAMGGYWVDYSEADQGAAGSGNSVKDLVDAIGTTKSATLFFKHNAADGNTTTYTFSTSETIPSNINIIIQNGARIAISNGVTLTISGGFRAGMFQVFSLTGTGTPSFGSLVPEILPEWMGAVDGTADDVQINYAITAASNNQIIKAYAATYTCSSTIALNKACTLSLGTTAITSTAENAITISADDVSVVGINRMTSKIISSGAGTHGIYAASATRDGITIRGLYFEGPQTVWVAQDRDYENAIILGAHPKVGYITNVVIRDNYFYGYQGMIMAYYVKNWQIVNNIFNHDFAGGKQVDMWNPYRVLISGNHFIDSGQSIGAVEIGGPADTKAQECKIDDNFFNGVWDFEIINFSGDRSSITNNYLYSSATAAVQAIQLLQGSSETATTLNDINVAYNIIELPNTTAGAIGLKNESTTIAMTRIAIENNRIIYGGTSTVIGTTTSGGVITELDINNNKIIDSGNGLDGITIINGVDLVRIKDNFISGCGRYGIYTAGLGPGTISKNEITGCATRGLYVAGGSDLIITHNRVYSNTLVGIYFSDDPVILDFSFNICHDNGGANFTFDGASCSFAFGNVPDTETLTGVVTLNYFIGAGEIDSSGGAVTGTLADGQFIGQIKTIVMTNATASSTVSISHHQTSDPEIATFDAVDETGVFMWTGTEWITLFATCTFV